MSPHVRPGENHIAARRLESLYDFRLVRPPKESQWSKVVRCRHSQLGDRPVRIPATGAGKPDRLHSVEPCAVEDNPGSDHPFGICTVCSVLYERADQARLPMGRPMLGSCRLLHLPVLIRLVLLCREKPLRIDGGHTTRAGGGYRLAVNMILHIAARKHARNIGMSAVMSQNISDRI